MPLDYHISADEGLITVHGQGETPLPEIVRLGRALLEDEDYDPELPQLVDFRGLRPVAEEGLDDLQDFLHGPYREGVAANVAVVIDEHLEDRHCADIFQLTCALHDAELFADYDQALKWLMRQAFATQPLPEPLLAEQMLPEHEDAGGEHAHRSPE